MPTCPAFSSDGVPGPDCGAESAPSVALYAFSFQCYDGYKTIDWEKEATIFFLI